MTEHDTVVRMFLSHFDNEKKLLHEFDTLQAMSSTDKQSYQYKIRANVLQEEIDALLKDVHEYFALHKSTGDGMKALEAREQSAIHQMDTLIVENKELKEDKELLNEHAYLVEQQTAAVKLLLEAQKVLHDKTHQST